MRIKDWDCKYRVTGIAQLQAILAIRHSDRVNKFTLSPEDHDYPQLVLVVEDAHAALAYFVSQEKVFTSLGDKMAGEPTKALPFFLDDRIHLTSEETLPFDVASAAAQDFFRTNELPRRITWRPYHLLPVVKDMVSDESEWLSYSDPWPMLAYLKDKVSDRKLRLFGVACCRRIAHLFANDDGEKIISIAEKYADGICSAHDLITTGKSVPTAKSLISNSTWRRKMLAGALYRLCDLNPYEGIKTSVRLISAIVSFLAADPEARVSYAFALRLQSVQLAFCTEKAMQAALLRDIIGNPFRPVNLTASLTLEGHKLARTIYEDSAFGMLPELADELEKAGSINQDIIGHCRNNGQHVRGCWVVDLALGNR